MSNFNSILTSQESGNTSARNEYNRAVAYSEYLASLSADYDGTDPADALTPDQVEVIDEFLDEVNRRSLPNAEAVDLRVRRTGRNAWSKPKAAKFSTFETKVGMRQIWSGRAYSIGKLVVENMASQPEVILCEDGMLRVDRHPRFFVKSKALGFGTLPEDKPSRRAVIGLLGYSKTGFNDVDRFSNELAKIISPRPTPRKSGYI